jgi:hypothetical protein
MFKRGVVECQKPDDATAGLALLWPIKGFGKVLLPTTCLPEKQDSYNLNVEIARAKLMEIVKKREEWSLFSKSEGQDGIYKEAQSLFIEAIQNLSDAALASKLADRALEKAIIFSEQMTNGYSQLLFNTRAKNHGFSRGCMGCKVNPKRINDARYVERLLDLFSFVTIPINWSKVEKEQGTYDFSSIDACVKVLGKRRLAICGGSLLCFSKECIPKWLLESKSGFEEIRDAAYDFVTTMVSRYSGVIRAWRVVSGLNVFNHFGFNFEQVLEMTRAAAMAVKAASDRSVKIIEIANPCSEYYSTTPNTIPALVYIDMVMQAAISFEAFGLQLQFGKNQSGMRIRDMMQISTVLDNFSGAVKPVYITELEVPSEVEGDSGGIWHKQWNEDCQKQWIEQFYKLAFSKPFINAVTYSNLTDSPDSVINHSGLLKENFESKKSFLMLKKMHLDIFGR